MTHFVYSEAPVSLHQSIFPGNSRSRKTNNKGAWGVFCWQGIEKKINFAALGLSILPTKLNGEWLIRKIENCGNHKLGKAQPFNCSYFPNSLIHF